MFAGGVSGRRTALLLGGGVLGLFAGIALLAPRLVKPLARVVGWPARRAGGVAGELAGANAVRNPGRTASTAAALMIGLTLVTLVAVLGAGIDTPTQVGASRSSSTPTTSSTATRTCRSEPPRATSWRRSPGVKAASHVRSDKALVQGKETHDHGRRPRDDRALLPLRLDARAPTARSPSSASDGALVTKSYAEAQAPDGRRRPLVDHDAVGREAHAGRARHLRPAAAQPLLGDVSITQQAFDAAFTQPEEQLHVPRRRRRRRRRRSRPRPQGYGDADVPHRRRLREGRDQGHGHVPRRCSTCCSASRSS